jgi:chromosome segregation ATPase
MGNIVDRLDMALSTIPECVSLEEVTFVFNGKEIEDILDLHKERETRINDQWERFRAIEAENADLRSESANLRSQAVYRNKEIDRLLESLREYGELSGIRRDNAYLKEEIADLKAENADLIFRVSKILEALSDLPQGE